MAPGSEGSSSPAPSGTSLDQACSCVLSHVCARVCGCVCTPVYTRDARKLRWSLCHDRAGEG